ncbi:hypothetical protein QT235_16355 [Geobacillus stearothermophilus]|nr:hypothetical protein QT235_16355 [Geobacillus stearothermophilus]
MPFSITGPLGGQFSAAQVHVASMPLTGKPAKSIPIIAKTKQGNNDDAPSAIAALEMSVLKHGRFLLIA